MLIQLLHQYKGVSATGKNAFGFLDGFCWIFKFMHTLHHKTP